MGGISSGERSGVDIIDGTNTLGCSIGFISILELFGSGIFGRKSKTISSNNIIRIFLELNDLYSVVIENNVAIRTNHSKVISVNL